MADHERFRRFLEEYVQFVEEMAAGESEKYRSLLSYDPKRVDRAVAGQQALNMRLSQLEAQREREQALAGLEGLGFREIPARLDEGEREAFAGLFERFERAVLDVKYFNGKALSFAKEGMQALDARPQGQVGSYDAEGRRPEQARPAARFETQV